MPATNYAAEIMKRRKTKLSNRIRGKMMERGITQADLGRKLGISQVAVSQKIKRCGFDASELLVVFDALEFSDRDILETMTEGRQ